jgi:hypothetical protein
MLLKWVLTEHLVPKLSKSLLGMLKHALPYRVSILLLAALTLLLGIGDKHISSNNIQDYGGQSVLLLHWTAPHQNHHVIRPAMNHMQSIVFILGLGILEVRIEIWSHIGPM